MGNRKQPTPVPKGAVKPVPPPAPPSADPFIEFYFKKDEVVESLCKQDVKVLYSIIGGNSERHGGHVEWLSRTPQYHLQKVIRHAITAIAQLDMNEEIKGGENCVDHVERVVVRASMALAQLNKYMKEG